MLLISSSETYLNKTKWKLKIGDTIGTLIPYQSPIFNHFGDLTSISRIISVSFAYMKKSIFCTKDTRIV